LTKLTAAEEVKFVLATRAQTAPAVLAALAKDSDQSLRAQVAAQPKLSAEALKMLDCR
jgi:hypothetical protein